MLVSVFKSLFILCLLSIHLSGCASHQMREPSVHFNAHNSQEIALIPFYLSDPSAIGDDHAWYMTRAVSSGIPIAGFLKPNQMLVESFTHWVYSMNPSLGKGLSETGARVVSADCQGSLTGSIRMTSDKSVVGEVVYSDFSDDCSLVLDGTVPFQGSFDSSSGEMILELKLPPLTGRLGEKTLLLAGGLQLRFNAFKGEKQITTTISNLSLAESSGVRVHLNNMEFTWDNTGPYQKISLGGWLNYSDQGLVRISTASPIQISDKPGRFNSVYRSSDNSQNREPAHISHKRRLPFDGALLFHGDDDSTLRLLFSKPSTPGFFWIDGSDGLQTMGTL